MSAGAGTRSASEETPGAEGGLRLRDLADIVRSKIAGPFLLSLEAFFGNPDDAARTRQAGAVTRERVAAAYEVDVADVLECVWYDAVPAVKCVLRLSIRADSYLSSDVYGAQSHLPFGDLSVPITPSQGPERGA